MTTTETTKESWDFFQVWYSISGNIYTDEQTAWYIWQTITAFLNEKSKQDKETSGE